MRDLIGDNNGTINDYSRTVIIKKTTNDFADTPIQKEETTVKKIVQEKIIEAIIGAILTGISAALKGFISSQTYSTLDIKLSWLVLIAMLVLGIIGIGLLLMFLYDLVNVFSLLKSGKFVEFESKSLWIQKLIECFQKSENIVEEDTRITGKCYKNIEGKIYRMTGKECPICESRPIGQMYLCFDKHKNTYFWECSQNRVHQLEFDYKKNF